MLDPLLVDSVIAIESAGNPLAVNPRSKAKGLMQLMDATGAEWCERLRLGEYAPFNAEQNKAIGMAYLDHLIMLFGGSLELGLAAYNFGLGHLCHAQQDHKVWDWLDVRQYMPAETQKYVSSVLEEYQKRICMVQA